MTLEMGVILAVVVVWWLTSLAHPVKEPASPVLPENPAIPNPVLLRSPRNIVLFLDFDGVLHPGFTETFCHRHKLENILRDIPTVDVVVSSDWRRADMNYLKGLFSEDVRERIIGRTGYLEGRHARYREIVEFCRTHNIQRWLALDDDGALFPPNCPDLFLVDGREGLTEETTSRLSQRLTKISGGITYVQ